MSLTQVPGRGAERTVWVRLGEALLSRNLWLLIAAFEVALALLSTMPGDARRPLLNLAAGFLASTALLVVVWLGWIVLLRYLSGPARLAAAVPVLLLAGAVRGSVLQALYVEWGMSLAGWEGFRFRIFNSVVVVLIAAVTGALLRVSVQSHRRRMEELEAVQRRLSLALSQAEVNVRVEQRQLLECMTATLTGELRLGRHSSSPVVAARSLEQLAQDVVRPLSHQLAATVPRWQPPDLALLQRRLDWVRVWGSVASPRNLNPLGPAAVVMVVLPSSVLHMGITAGLRLHLVAALLVYLGLAVLRKAAPKVARERPTAARLAATGALLVTACTPAAAAVWALSPEPQKVVNALYVILVLPVVAGMFSFIGAARSQQRLIEQAIEARVVQTQWWVRRTHMVQWWQNGMAARALHGPVQCAIHLSAQRLRSAADAGPADPDLIAEVLDDLSRRLTAAVIPGATVLDLPAELAELAASWHPLAVVEFTVDAAEAVAIAVDPVCAEVTGDVITEAVSNAVRHGGARRVHVSLSSVGNDEVNVEIVDDGRGWAAVPGDAPGLGTAQLDTCALWWQVVTSGDAHHLRVSLPWLPTATAAADGPQ